MRHSRVKLEARCRSGTEGSCVMDVVVAGAKSPRGVSCLSSGSSRAPSLQHPGAEALQQLKVALEAFSLLTVQ